MPMIELPLNTPFPDRADAASYADQPPSAPRQLIVLLAQDIEADGDELALSNTSDTQGRFLIKKARRCDIFFFSHAWLFRVFIINKNTKGSARCTNGKAHAADILFLSYFSSRASFWEMRSLQIEAFQVIHYRWWMPFDSRLLAFILLQLRAHKRQYEEDNEGIESDPTLHACMNLGTI